MIEIKNSELKQKINQALENIDQDEYICGIRFENKDREIGEICEWSKDNVDREDEREFPKYGSTEYNELPELEGSSAWDVEMWEELVLSGWSDTSYFESQHIYVVGDYTTTNGPDDGEILMKNAVVLAKII